MKLKITNRRIDWANKEGQPYLDKQSRPYARVAIQVESYGKKWLSGFSYKDGEPLKWNIGDEVELEVKEEGQYTNFKVPKVQKQSDGVWTPEIVEKLFIALQRIEMKIDNLELVESPIPSPDELGKDEIPEQPF